MHMVNACGAVIILSYADLKDYKDARTRKPTHRATPKRLGET